MMKPESLSDTSSFQRLVVTGAAGDSNHKDRREGPRSVWEGPPGLGISGFSCRGFFHVFPMIAAESNLVAVKPLANTESLVRPSIFQLVLFFLTVSTRADFPSKFGGSSEALPFLAIVGKRGEPSQWPAG